MFTYMYVCTYTTAYKCQYYSTEQDQCSRYLHVERLAQHRVFRRRDLPLLNPPARWVSELRGGSFRGDDDGRPEDVSASTVGYMEGKTGSQAQDMDSGKAVASLSLILSSKYMNQCKIIMTLPSERENS